MIYRWQVYEEHGRWGVIDPRNGKPSMGRFLGRDTAIAAMERSIAASKRNFDRYDWTVGEERSGDGWYEIEVKKAQKQRQRPTRFDDEEWEAIVAEADRLNISANELVRRACTKYLQGE